MRFIDRLKKFLPWIGAVLTGLGLSACFAPLEDGALAWVVLVPLLLALRSTSPRKGFWLGFLSGTMFWLAGIHWLIHVTVAGWVALSLYCALYLGGFAALTAAILRRWGTTRWYRNLAHMTVLSAVWAGLEYVRANLFTGFCWNLLGVSQYNRIPLIQVAAWGGVFAVSALVVLVNTAAALTVLRYVDQRKTWRRQPHPELMIAFLVLLLVTALGWKVVRGDTVRTRPVRVAMIQPNIPQNVKWTLAFVDRIHKTLGKWTTAVLHAGRFDLIVWPETALPDDVLISPASYEVVYRMATNGVPILVGSMDTRWRDDAPPAYYNSSFLFGADGRLLEAYDKQHLVIFGEYVPFQHLIPFVNALTPIQESFSAGARSTVFTLPGHEVPFSVLICFEDTVPALARRAVHAGARFLVNQTNDAWFDPSGGSRQHMVNGVFRCVENRVPGIRCTNSGVTCAINRFGRVVRSLEPMAEGFLDATLEVPDAAPTPTFYTRYGDVFGMACAGATLCLCVGMILENRLRRRENMAAGTEAG